MYTEWNEKRGTEKKQVVLCLYVSVYTWKFTFSKTKQTEKRLEFNCLYPNVNTCILYTCMQNMSWPASVHSFSKIQTLETWSYVSRWRERERFSFAKFKSKYGLFDLSWTVSWRRYSIENNTHTHTHTHSESFLLFLFNFKP